MLFENKSKFVAVSLMWVVAQAITLCSCHPKDTRRGSLDYVPVAIERATAKAKLERGIKANFLVGNALELEKCG